jgi:acetyltransferase EpsM
VAVFDDDPTRVGTSFRGLNVCGPFPKSLRDGEHRAGSIPPGDAAIVAVGDARSRRAVVLSRPDWTWRTVRHRLAAINEWDVSIGDGCVVLPHTVVGANARIGEHSILNSGAIVAHGVQIGAYTHIGAQSVIAGDAVIGDGAFVGIGSMVNPGCVIGAGTKVGAGSVVSRDLPPGVVAVGTPARVVRELPESERWC